MKQIEATRLTGWWFRLVMYLIRVLYALVRSRAPALLLTYDGKDMHTGLYHTQTEAVRRLLGIDLNQTVLSHGKEED